MICFLNYSISPYHAARFKSLKEKIDEDIIFVELASKSSIYPWSSQAEKVDAITLHPDREIATIPPSVLVKSVRDILNENKPKIVLSVSYASAGMREGAFWARRNGSYSICVNETWAGDKRRWFHWEMIKSLWCRYAYDAMFVGGIRSMQYYQKLGFPGEKIWQGQNCVDNDYFSIRSKEARDKAAKYRKLLNLPSTYFLCAARLSPEKNLFRLIKAFAVYKSAGGKWDLVITGSGPLETKLNLLIRKLGISSYVHLAGWKQIDEMPVYFGLASCLILPSISEPWGLVVNEAMACSLPVLVSDMCGCSPELCFHGVNGFNFNPFKEENITEVMLNISSGNYDLQKMGRNSFEFVNRFSPQNYAASLTDCIHTLQRKII